MTRGMCCCMKQIVMTPSLVTRTIKIAKKMLEDNQFTGRVVARRRIRFGKGSSYVITLLKQATPDRGMVCRKCDLFIRPGEHCYSKQGNNDQSVRTYYHMTCGDRLYH